MSALASSASAVPSRDCAARTAAPCRAGDEVTAFRCLAVGADEAVRAAAGICTVGVGVGAGAGAAAGVAADASMGVGGGVGVGAGSTGGVEAGSGSGSDVEVGAGVGSGAGSGASGGAGSTVGVSPDPGCTSSALAEVGKPTIVTVTITADVSASASRPAGGAPAVRPGDRRQRGAFMPHLSPPSGPIVSTARMMDKPQSGVPRPPRWGVTRCPPPKFGERGIPQLGLGRAIPRDHH